MQDESIGCYRSSRDLPRHQSVGGANGTITPSLIQTRRRVLHLQLRQVVRPQVGQGAEASGLDQAHATTGVFTNVITALEVTPKEPHDSPFFPALLAKTSESVTIREISADTGYSSKANLQAVTDLGATPLIPFKVSRIGVVGPQRPLFDVTETPPEATACVPIYHYFAYPARPVPQPLPQEVERRNGLLHDRVCPCFG